MIGLDTNVLIRYLVQDDAKQTPLATRFIEAVLSPTHPGYISHVVLCEMVWVLEDCYGQSSPQVAALLEQLYRAKEIVVQEPALAWQALRLMQIHGADFSDALIMSVGQAAGCQHTVTFDKQAAKLESFELLREA